MAFEPNLAHRNFLNKVGTQLYPSVYILSVAAFCAIRAEVNVAREIVWPTKPEIFTIWPCSRSSSSSRRKIITPSL